MRVRRRLVLGLILVLLPLSLFLVVDGRTTDQPGQAYRNAGCC